jgi:hypothetical protein
MSEIELRGRGAQLKPIARVAGITPKLARTKRLHTSTVTPKGWEKFTLIPSEIGVK